jgi:hypothetical protein
MSPPVEERVARDTLLNEVARAGLHLDKELTFLPHQYFFLIKPGK